MDVKNTHEILLDNRKLTTRDLVQIALMTALIFITTYLIQIPVGAKAVFHIGDGMLFLGALLLGKKKGTIAAALGMTLFDLSGAWFYWAPVTFIGKGLMAYVTSVVAYKNGHHGENFKYNFLGCIAGGITMVIVYYLGGLIVYQLMMSNALLANLDIIHNIGQVIVGMVIALPLSMILSRIDEKTHFLNHR